jgi:hypothetical protein
MPEGAIVTEWGGQFSRGLWRYIRPRFAAAGQDSFSDPPGQNEDMFESLVNVMPPVQGDFDRRWGYSLFNGSVPMGAAPNTSTYPMYLWNNDPPGAARLLLQSTSTGFYSVAEDGSSIGNTVTLQAPGAHGQTSRGQFYVADGVLPQAWSPTLGNSTRNWGIDINNAAVGPVGPDSPGTVATSGSPIWVNPNNIKVADGVFSTVSVSGGVLPGGLGTTFANSGPITATNFGFALTPGTTIVGVLVEAKAKVVESGGTKNASQVQLTMNLTFGGVQIGTFKFAPMTPGAALAYVSGGGSTDLWGASVSSSTVDDTTFGATLFANGGWSNAGGGTASTLAFSVDHLRITVFVNAPPVQILGTAGGSVTLVSGRIYQVTFYNSQVAPQPFSGLNLPSASTGPLTAQQISLGSITVSNDPQVDRKKLLATADGGDLTTLYELADLPNAQTTYTDNTPELTLLLSNQYQAVLTDGTEVGVADNTPPPATCKYPTLHRGRMYCITGSYVVFSKAEEELLTPTGILAGRFEESFPVLNSFPITNLGETGRGLLSDGTVLYIGTNRRVVRLFGDGPNTFLKPQVLFDNVGVLNQEVWSMVLIEGNPLGAMWLTPDYRVMGSDFNTYQDVGTPIQNILDSINRTAAPVTAWAANVNISVFNLWVLAVPTGSNTQPDTLLVFDIKGRKWYTWSLTDTAVSGFWWVTLAGQPQFVIQAATGKLYVFDPSLFQDRVGDTPQSFPVTMRTSWLALGDGTARKLLNEAEISTADQGMTLTVEGASLISEFNNPQLVVLNAPLVIKPRGELVVYLAGSTTRERYYRFTFNATDAATDLLRSFNVQGRILNRL